MYLLKPFDAPNWDAIDRLADLAVPFDTEGNRVTIARRAQFDDAAFERRQYTITDDDGTLVGYGSIEQQPEGSAYRQFILLASGDLWESVGQMLYERLNADLHTLGAAQVW